MTAIKIEKFGGQLPAWNDILLPEGQASYSRNCYLYSGALTGWRQPKPLRPLTNPDAKFAYRVVNKLSNNTALTAPDSYWLEMADPDTTVLHSPVVQDEWNRYYYASPSVVPRYTTYDRIANGQNDWILGVPASDCTPGLTVEGGGDAVQFGFPSQRPEDVGTSAFRFANGMFFIPFTPTGSMLIQSIGFVPASTSTETQFQAVVYSDFAGIPHERIGVGTLVTGIVAGAPANSILENGVSVISNVTYWLGIAHDSAMYVQVADSRTSLGATATNTFSNGPPEFVTAVAGAPNWQLYAFAVGASVFEARSYVYTWVTEYGEEGPPSPPVVVNGWSNAVWTIELFKPTLNNMGGGTDPETGTVYPPDRNITKTRIYRTISNQAGQGTYFFVAEIPVTQGTYVDVLPDDQVALNSQLVSLYWFGPPEDLQEILAFPNGIAVGFRKNEVWFSEAYRPHAWPPGYVLTTEFPIVGLGVCGQSIVAVTQGPPYLINGVNPSSMSMTKINLPEPGLHRGSIVPTDTSVFYVSQNGLIQINQSGKGDNITEGWITRERWNELAPMVNVRAVKLASMYYAFGIRDPESPLSEGYTIELGVEDKTSFTIWPQAGAHRLGFNSLTSPNGYPIIDNLTLDPYTGTALLIQDHGVWYHDFTDQDPVIVPYLWRSKKYQQIAKKNFSAVRAFFSVPSTTPPQIARNTSDPQPELGYNQYAVLRCYADGKLFTTREIRRSGELLRIYASSKYETWQFEIEGRVVFSNIQIATSTKELALI
jgi:hypothetical protein